MLPTSELSAEGLTIAPRIHPPRQKKQPAVSIDPASAIGDPVTAWAQDVVIGRVVQGPWVRATCQRHLTDLVESPKRGLKWDLASAQRAIGFFRDVLRLNGGQFEGLPFILHPAQMFYVGALFGWKRADGTRRFRRAYIETAKGSGKSPALAGIGLYGMVADGESRAEIYAAASKKDQAMILFRDAVAMLEQSPSLNARLTKSGINPVWNIADLKTGSFFRPISSDDSKSGPRPHMALCDEVHEHKDRSTTEMLERGFKFRRQPLLVMATNSGSDRKSICWEEHQHAVNVARGHDDSMIPVVDDTTFSFVSALDAGDDPLEDPSCWVKTNPLLGVTITHDYLRDVVAQAKAIPGKRNAILRLHFCVWTDSETAWLERELWESIEDDALDEADFAGMPAFVGLDLGATRDITAKAMLIEDGLDSEDRRKFVAFVHGYLPEDGLREKAAADKAPYEEWVQAGHLTATPGKVTRLDYVARALQEDAQNFSIQAIAYDSWLIKKFGEELDEMGLQLPLMEHPQGWNRRKDSPLSMPDSINGLEQLILEKRLRVKINPALRSAVMGARFLTSEAGLRRFSKQKATQRIDMAVALAMATGAALAQPERCDNPYEDHGIRVL